VGGRSLAWLCRRSCPPELVPQRKADVQPHPDGEQRVERLSTPERVEAERLFDPQAVETRHPHVDDAGEELAVLKCVTGADRTHDGLIAGSDGISRVPELLEEHQRGI